jgi:phosphoglycolate phosphatase-like HAD superfamily hydrolase
MSSPLLLFDVDGTLISTSGVGIRAMELAGRQMFGGHFSVARTEFAGRLDPLIIADLLDAHSVEVSAPTIARFREGYREHLVALLAQPGIAMALPGVLDLLASLRPREDVCVGLLTGNYEQTGCIKLAACGIDVECFSLRVWGDECTRRPHSRDELPEIAMRKFSLARGLSIRPEGVWIIGDTPHDVRCARANGCRSLAVATGRFDAGALAAAGADAVAADLSDLAGTLAIFGLAG